MSDQDLKSTNESEWVIVKKQLSESQLFENIKKYAGDQSCFIILSVDAVKYGRFPVSEDEIPDVKNILEFRAFDGDREVLAKRLSLGMDSFNLRVAEGEAGNGYRTMERIHIVDYARATAAAEDFDKLIGSSCNLGKEKECFVRLLYYITYDHIGMAKISDVRVCELSMR